MQVERVEVDGRGIRSLRDWVGGVLRMEYKKSSQYDQGMWVV